MIDLRGGKYMSPKEFAQRSGITERTVLQACRQGRLLGAVKFQKGWIIPLGSYIIDRRIVHGGYVGEKYRRRNKTKRILKSKPSGVIIGEWPHETRDQNKNHSAGRQVY